MDQYCFSNGTFKKISEVALSPLDLGLTRGFAFFEYLRVYNKVPFEIEKHLERFYNAAKYFGLQLPLTKEKLIETTYKYIELCETSDFGIKYFLTAGPSGNGLTTELCEPTFLFYSTTLPKLPKEKYEQGLKVKTIKATRVFPEFKTTNYLPGTFYLKYYKNCGYDDVIYKNSQGHYLEGLTSNFFIFQDNTLITPSEGVLLGVTRDVSLRLAQESFDIQLRPITSHDIQEATGAFLASSNLELAPIFSIDNKKIGRKGLCENTKYLMQAFKDYVKKNTALQPITSS